MKKKVKENHNHSFYICSDHLCFLFLFPAGTRMSFQSAESIQDVTRNSNLPRWGEREMLISISEACIMFGGFVKDELRGDRSKGPNFLLQHCLMYPAHFHFARQNCASLCRISYPDHLPHTGICFCVVLSFQWLHV